MACLCPWHGADYGVNQRMDGPAVRDVDGFKLILASSGGGQGKHILGARVHLRRLRRLLPVCVRASGRIWTYLDGTRVLSAGTRLKSGGFPC